MNFSYFKKIFGSLSVFLVAFVIISLAADISFLQRKTTSLPGEDGWKGMPDFKVFWQAGNVILDEMSGEGEPSAGRRPLYDKQEPFYHFRYSPLAAIVMSPFSKIPYPRVAMLLWILAGNIAFLAAVLILTEHMRERFSLDSSFRVLMLWMAFLGTLRYYLVVICQGQTDGFAVFLLVLLLMAYIGRKDILTGILFAAIFQIKPYFAPLALFFLADKRYKAFLSSVVSILVFAVLPSLALGFSETIKLTKEYFSMVKSSGFSQVMNYKNQSVAYGAAIILQKAGGFGKVLSVQEAVCFFSGLFMLSGLAVFFGLMRYLKKIREEFYLYLALSVIIAMPVLFSPISWEAHYMFLIIPISLICVLAVRTHREKVMVFYLAGYFLLTLSTGTDITKFIPAMDDFRFINVSLGTLLLFVGIFHLYLAPPISGGER